MLDGQFSATQNNGEVGGIPSATAPVPGPGPGISVIVAPTGLSPSALGAEHNAWVNQAEAIDGKKIQLTDNMSTLDRVILCASELCGTAVLVFLGCVGCIDFGTPPTHLQICLTFGLAVMVAIQIFGHVSGGHINPVITVAAIALGNMPLIQLPIYFVGQLLGALGGFGLLKLATPANYLPTNGTGVCSPALGPNVSPAQGLLIEFTACFILTLVACGVWDVRNKNHHDSVPIRFGFTISVLALACGPYTGANMNPVRSFAPALINGNWDNHWVYWVGPLSAALIASLFYKVLFNKEENEVESNTAEVIPLNDKA